MKPRTKPVVTKTLRLPPELEAAVVNKLSTGESFNSYLIRLIEADLQHKEERI
jgi:hypothetical protein